MVWVSPRTWTTGEAVTAAKMNEVSASLAALSAKGTTYTPTITTGWTSNFTVAGNARTDDKWVDFLIVVNFTGAPAGSGGVLITLPSTPSADYPTWASIGGFTARDSSITSQTTGECVYAGVFGGVPTVSAYFGGTSRLANAAPYTFASGDYVSLTGRYYKD